MFEIFLFKKREIDVKLIWSQINRRIDQGAARAAARRRQRAWIENIFARHKQVGRDASLPWFQHELFRNEKAKTRREYLAHQADLEEKRKKEVEMDYLAPFLAQLGHPKSFTKEDVAKLTRDCLEGRFCENIVSNS